MKYSKEKGRAPAKGRRRLEFGTPKQQLPLLNKAVYMDIKNSRQADLMEEQLKKLGARVEKFLSVEVNYVISSSGPSKPDDKLSREENPQSPSFVPSPFNCVPSPTVQPEAKTVIVSRGKALAQIACAKNKASSVVTSAEKLGIKVVSAEAATKWLEKEIRKMNRGVESNVKENKSKKTEVKPKESKTKSKVLMGSFIKFEDNSRHYRPVKVELDRWPRLNLAAPPGICPFGEAKVKVQNLYGARTQFHDSHHVVGSAAVPTVPTHAAPDPVVVAEEDARAAPKPETQQELVGVPIATTGDAQRILHFHFKKNLAINKQQGYCDCCGVKFHNIDEHVKGEEHRAFARQKCNYESLDVLISQIPSTVNFLQSVLLKHCVQRHEEPTVSSCPSAQYVNLMPPISPLTTDKTNVPSQETAATGLKTPDPSGQEMATFKEHFAATDTDLISKRDMVTPTKREPAVDSRPQAVVIRRPVPSGMFTSPRRRPVTPSKKPWMQERSMVFSDSPIGSLQPSPCTSKETLPNFLCENTVNSLTRLATVCDKSNIGKPNHTSEGSEATKQLFSMILNQNFATKLRKKKSVTAQLGKKVTGFCQTRSGSVKQAQEIKNSPLEVRTADVDRENVKHSDNENMAAEEDKAEQGAEEDKAEQGFHQEKCYAVEHEAAFERCRMRESMMINTESKVNDSCDEKITAKQKLEFSYIDNKECTDSNKEVIVSPHTDNSVVEKEKLVKDSENKSLTVAEEMECAASIHEKQVHVEQDREVMEWNQEIEMTAKQKQEKIGSSHDTGLSIQQEKECAAVIHENITTVEQKPEISLSVEQENKVAECSQEKDMIANQELEKFSHNASMSVEQEPEMSLSVEREIKCTSSVIHESITTVEEENKVAECSQEKDMTANQELGKLVFSHEASKSVEQEPEASLSVEQENEVAECSQEKDMTANQELGKLVFGHEASKSVEQEPEALGCNEFVIVKQDMEEIGPGCDRSVTVEREVERTVSGHGTVTAVEQRKGVTGSQCEQIVIVEQEEAMDVLESSHDIGTAIEQEQEVTSFGHKKTVIEQEREEPGFSHDNGVTVEQAKEVTRFSHNSITVEQEKEEIGFSHDNSITAEQEKEEIGFSHDNSITAEQEKEEIGFSHDITVEQEKEEISFSHDITVEQEKEEIGFSHDNSITAEQEKEEIGFSHDITAEQEKEEIGFSHDITAEQEKEEIGFSHDNSITAEQEKEEIGFSHDNSITAEQEKEEIGFSHDITAEQEREEIGFSHDNSITAEQDKEEIGFSHDNSITAEQDKEEIGFSHDNSITAEQEKKEIGFSHIITLPIEQAKEVTSFNCDNNIAVEQESEISFSHDNSIIVEQEKEVTGFSRDNSITVDQETEVTEPRPVNSVTIEGGGYSDRIMTVGNVFSVPETNCWERMTVQEKEIINEKSTAVEETMEKEEPSHKKGVTFEDEKIGSNFNNEKCKVFVDTEENTANDINMITFQQAYSNNDKNMNVEQEMEEISSNQGKKSICFLFENEETDSAHDKFRIYEEEIKEKGTSQEKMVAIEGKIERSLNQMQIGYVEEVKAESNSSCEKMTAIEEKKEPSSNQMQIGYVEEGKEESSSNHDKQIAVSEQGKVRDKNVFVEQKVVTNSSRDKRKVIGQEKEQTNFNLGKSVLIKNVITVKQFHNDVYISDQDKCEAVENKEKKRSGHTKRLTDEQGNRMEGSSREKIIAREENKKERVYNHEQDKSIERRKERKHSKERGTSIEEKAMSGSICKEGMTVEKRKEEKRSNHEKHAAVEENKRHIDSKQDEYVAVKMNKVKKSSDHVQALIDDHSNMKGPSQGKSVAVGEKMKTKVSNCEKEKSVERRKKRDSSSHEKHLSVEDKKHKDSNHDEYVAAENKKEKTSFPHENVLADEQGSNNEEKSVERRKERKSSGRQKSASVEEKESKGFSCKGDAAVEKRKERNRSDLEKHESAEETKERNRSQHEKHASAEERNRSNHEKHASAEEIKQRKRSDQKKHASAEEMKERNRSKHASAEETKERNRSKHEKHASAEETKERNRSKHEKHKSAEERNRSNHEKHTSAEEMKQRKRSDEEKHASAEEIKSHLVSIHDACKAAENKEENEGSDHGKKLIYEPRTRNKDSSREKYVAVEEKKKTNVCGREEDKCVERKQDWKSYNHEHIVSVEKKNMNNVSSKEGMPVEKKDERKRSRYEKYLAAEGKNNKNKNSNHVSMAVEKDQKSSLHEQGLTDDQRSPQTGSKHEEDGGVEKRKERKRSNHEKHAPAEEMKRHIDFKYGERMDVENKNEKDSCHHERNYIDKPRDRDKYSSHEKNIAVEEKTKTKFSNRKEDKSVERNKERKSINHEKHSAAEENNRNNEHIAVENKERKSSHCKKGLIDDQRKQKSSQHEDKSVERRKESQSSNHVEEKDMKISTGKEGIAGEKRKERQRSNHKKQFDCKHDACTSVECKKEKESSHHEKRLSGEQGNRKKSSSLETNIAMEDKKKAKVSNWEENRYVDRKTERKPSKHERSLSFEGEKMSNYQEGVSVEKKRERKSSNHGKHLAAEGKKSNEEYTAVENKKEMKSFHHEKELADEQRIQQKGYNQQEDKISERKISNEKHTVAEELTNHLKSIKPHEHMAVERSNPDTRLINEPRNRTSSSHDERLSVEKDNKSKVSSREKDKSVERKKERKISNHERSLSVEKKEITVSNCKEDLATEKRKDRKRSNHEKHKAAEEKKKKKGSECGESTAVDKIAKKSSDQETSSNVQQEKNRIDCDMNKSHVVGRNTAHMNPVVRICGRELRQCMVSDALAETVYKHLAGRSASTEASNLIYVASHKVSINNLLLKEGQISGQASPGIDSCSAHASADAADQGVLKSKNGPSCPHKCEDTSGHKKTGCKMCKDVDRACVQKEVKSNTQSKSTNLNQTVSADVRLNEETDRAACDNALGCPGNISRESLLKEKPGICKTKIRESLLKEKPGICKTKIRESLLKEKPGICKTKIRKSRGKEVVSDLHGHFQEPLEKQEKDFEAGQKAGNIDKYVETGWQFGFQATGQVIRGVGEMNARRSNTQFQNPNMQQSAEVRNFSKPAGNLNEVICNSQDSYMDEDTVDVDFYESHNGGRQNNNVNTDGLSDVHTPFPYISSRAAFPHSTELTTLPTTTQPTLTPHTTQSKTENVVTACDANNSDCKLTRDQNVHQPRSNADSLDARVRDHEVDIRTEYRNNCSYAHARTRASRQHKQVNSDGSLQLNIQQRHTSEEKCVDEDSASADKEMVGPLSGDRFSAESARRMSAASEEVSTSGITSSSLVVVEQSEHPLREGSPFEEEDTDSLLSSENMRTVKTNSDEDSDFIELIGQLENVVVPNIAERVKSRSRVAGGAPSSAIDKEIQRSGEEKRARRRRKKEFRERHRPNSLDSIHSQQVQQSGDTSEKFAARNVMSNSGDKRHKNAQTHKSTPTFIVPNIAESVKNRRSCTMFNHLGQYANSGEGTDGEDENIKVKPRSDQKTRQRKYYSSRERNLKALSSKSGVEYDKNGLVKHSRVVYSQRKSNDVKVDSSTDLLPEMETDGKTSSLSGCPSKAEDEASDLSPAVVVRRKKSHVYPSNKRPEVDWGKVQPSDGSSEPDPVENSLLRETRIVAEKNKTRDQSDLNLKSSHQGCSHSATGSQARQVELIREAKVVLVDINTSPIANTHTNASSSRYHSDIHGGTPTSPYHTNIQTKTSSSPYHANIHTNSPTIHYPTDVHIKTSTSPCHTNINVKTPTRRFCTDGGDPVIRRSRHRKAKRTETSGQPLCSKCPHSVRSISDVPSSPGISCSPRLRLKIRRRSGNKGFSSTLEEVHDCLPNVIGCSSHVNTEHCGDSCECPNRFEDKYSSRIDNLSTEPLTQHCMARSSSDLLPHAQYGELSQSDIIKSSKRAREPSPSYNSDSESTLEYPLNIEAVSKRIKLSPDHCTDPDVYNYNADDQHEVPLYITAGDTSANTSLPRDHMWGHSSDRFRPSSPCFSSPVTKRYFQCFTTPQKSDAPDRPAVGSESPVFNLSMKQLRHAQSSHSSASADGLSGGSAPPAGMSHLAVQNAGLQTSVRLDSSLTLKQTSGRHLSAKRLLSPPNLNFPSAKKTKVDTSCSLAADRRSVQFKSKQETIPFDNFAESSNHGFHSLFQGASKLQPASDFKRTVNHVLPSNSASTSQHGLTSVLPFAGALQLDPKSFDSTEWVTCTTTDRNIKPENPNSSDEDTVMLLEIEGFPGVSDLGFEDLLSQVHTFSSPDKATDTSWGDICDTYLSASFNNHNIHNLGQPGIGKSPAGRGAKVVSFSPCRKQFKNVRSPLRKRTAEESAKGQTVSGYRGHSIKEKTTIGPERSMSKDEANCPGLDTVEQELQTPVKNSDNEDLKFSPYIQRVDDVISFNFMSPQRLKSSPSTKLLLSPQTEHRRSHTVSHSRRLFSPAKMSPQGVASSPHHTHRSSLQSLFSPQTEHRRPHTASHSKRLFSPVKKDAADEVS